MQGRQQSLVTGPVHLVTLQRPVTPACLASARALNTNSRLSLEDLLSGRRLRATPRAQPQLQIVAAQHSSSTRLREQVLGVESRPIPIQEAMAALLNLSGLEVAPLPRHAKQPAGIEVEEQPAGLRIPRPRGVPQAMRKAQHVEQHALEPAPRAREHPHARPAHAGAHVELPQESEVGRLRPAARQTRRAPRSAPSPWLHATAARATRSAPSTMEGSAARSARSSALATAVASHTAAARTSTIKPSGSSAKAAEPACANGATTTEAEPAALAVAANLETHSARACRTRVATSAATPTAPGPDAASASNAPSAAPAPAAAEDSSGTATSTPTSSAFAATSSHRPTRVGSTSAARPCRTNACPNRQQLPTLRSTFSGRTQARDSNLLAGALHKSTPRRRLICMHGDQMHT